MNYYYLYMQSERNNSFSTKVLAALFKVIETDFTPKHTHNEIKQLVAMLSNLTENLISKHNDAI